MATYIEHDSSLSDGDITNLLAEAGVEDSILDAAVYAVRNNDFAHLIREYNRLAGPVIDKAAADEELQSAANAADARFESRMDRAA